VAEVSALLVVIGVLLAVEPAAMCHASEIKLAEGAIDD